MRPVARYQILRTRLTVWVIVMGWLSGVLSSSKTLIMSGHMTETSDYSFSGQKSFD